MVTDIYRYTVSENRNEKKKKPVKHMIYSANLYLQILPLKGTS